MSGLFPAIFVVTINMFISVKSAHPQLSLWWQNCVFLLDPNRHFKAKILSFYSLKWFMYTYLTKSCNKSKCEIVERPRLAYSASYHLVYLIFLSEEDHFIHQPSVSTICHKLRLCRSNFTSLTE